MGWNSRGVSSLLTVWRLPSVRNVFAFSGCRGQIENAFYHKASCRAVNGTPCGDTLMPYGNIEENRACFTLSRP
ncbi:hypothetical protein D3Z36_14715 [Lachnospiraceae bacterium]|nr:hypothetical protein [Lachnospiraceae bacterium]